MPNSALVQIFVKVFKITKYQEYFQNNGLFSHSRKHNDLIAKQQRYRRTVCVYRGLQLPITFQMAIFGQKPRNIKSNNLIFGQALEKIFGQETSRPRALGTILDWSPTPLPPERNWSPYVYEQRGAKEGGEGANSCLLLHKKKLLQNN